MSPSAVQNPTMEDKANQPRVQQSDLAPVLVKLLKFAFGLGGSMALATGVWMLAAPATWFEVFPGSIGDTGPMNTHFVRDLGGWNVALGVLLLFALTNPVRFGGVALIVSAVGLGSHAVTHVTDIIAGRLPAEHWVVDTPLVFGPFIVVGVLLWIWWSLQTERYADVFEQESDADSDLEPERSGVFNDF